MIKTNEVRQLSVSIACKLDQAYAFLSVAENFPKWASGLAGSLRRLDDEWLAETSQGTVRIRFSEPNAYGVLDHWVFLPTGGEVYVPLRVVANGDGCELTLTLLRQPGMSDEKFQADTDWVLRDLATAKRLLEGGAA